MQLHFLVIRKVFESPENGAAHNAVFKTFSKRYVASGRVKAVVAAENVYPLSNAAEAATQAFSGRIKGKVVVQVVQ